MIDRRVSDSFVHEISKEAGIASGVRSFFSSAARQAGNLKRNVVNADKHLRIGGVGKLDRAKGALGRTYRGLKNPANRQLRNAVIGTGVAGAAGATGYALNRRQKRTNG